MNTSTSSWLVTSVRAFTVLVEFCDTYILCFVSFWIFSKHLSFCYLSITKFASARCKFLC